MCTSLYTTALGASVERLAAARPMLVGVAAAGEVVDGLGPSVVTHAGPPIEPSRMCDPMRAAIGTALAIEGISGSPGDALALVDGGEVEVVPNHDLGGVGPMSGVVTASMPVWVVRDEATGRTAWCNLNEGSGAVLRYGADGPEVVERLRWMRDVLAPALAAALDAVGPIDLIDVQARALVLGDECHHRTGEGTRLIHEALAPGLAGADPAVDRFIAGNTQFFLNLAMASAKLALDCAAGVVGSPLVTAIARNGVEVGVRLSGTGDRWFTGPAALPEPAALYAGYEPADMCRDLGDSAIVETYGLGALAAAASPEAAPSVGLPADGVRAMTERLRAIAAGESADLTLPGAGPAILGIDARRVVETGLLPPIHTGIAHRRPGVGQIGGGITHPPREAFAAAVAALHEGFAAMESRPAAPESRPAVPDPLSAASGVANEAV